MAVSMVCRWAPRRFNTKNLQGSVTLLRSHVTISGSTHNAQSRTNHHVDAHLPNQPSDQKIVLNSDSSTMSNNSDIFLSGILSRLSLSPAELNLTNEYLLPSRNPWNERANILDPVPSAQIRDCPTSVLREIIERPWGQNKIRIETPPNSRGKPVEKRAKQIMKIRRKKMKKHQYLKWKKRNKFLLRSLFAKRRAKKQKLFEERLDSYRFKGLTQDFIEWHNNKTKNEAATFLNHLGIPLEEETPEVLEEKREKEKARAKKITVFYDPQGSMKVYPTPILPEGSSLKRILAEQERRARERMVKLDKQS